MKTHNVFLILVFIALIHLLNSKSLTNSNSVYANTNGCYLQMYYRGYSYPSVCPSGQNYLSSGCYNNCKSGYSDDGQYCYLTDCPYAYDVYDNTALNCKPKDNYGRGSGYVTKSKCQKNDHGLGCEKWGLLYYPKCQQGYGNAACCICDYKDKCPDGYTATNYQEGGVQYCTKPHYTKTKTSDSPTCGTGFTSANSKCYPDCLNGYTGAEYTCQKVNCPSKYPYKCGNYLCVTDSSVCTSDVSARATGAHGFTLAKTTSIGVGTFYDLSLIFNDYKTCTNIDYLQTAIL